MVKIKISYEDDKELMQAIQILSPVLKLWKKSGNGEGRYKKAYAELNFKRNAGKHNM